MNVGDLCWRDSAGVAALELPWRVILPDGSTRTDPSQWSEDQLVLDATGWQRSTLTQADVDALTPQPTPPPGWQTPLGWSLGVTPQDVSLLTGLYVLAARREQLGQSQPVAVTDTEGTRHSLAFAEFEIVMLGYGAAVEARYAST